MPFYEDISAYYDLIFPVGGEQVEFIRSSAGTPPKSLLDIACGTGGYALELVRHGYNVTAADIDGKMIEMLQKKIEMLQQKLDLADYKKSSIGSGKNPYTESDAPSKGLSSKLHIECHQAGMLELERKLGVHPERASGNHLDKRAEKHPDSFSGNHSDEYFNVHQGNNTDKHTDKHSDEQAGNHFGKRFDLAFCIGNSVVHLDNMNEILVFFKSVKNLLKSGGKFIIQIVNYDRVLSKGVKELPVIKNHEIGLCFERFYSRDIKSGKILFRTILTVDGRRIENEIPLFPLLSEDAVTMLKAAGFDDILLFGDFNRNMFDRDNSFMLVIQAQA